MDGQPSAPASGKDIDAALDQDFNVDTNGYSAPPPVSGTGDLYGDGNDMATAGAGGEFAQAGDAGYGNTPSSDAVYGAEQDSSAQSVKASQVAPAQ